MLAQELDVTTRLLGILPRFQALHRLTYGDELHRLQAVDVLRMLYRKRGVILYDTGLGKTYLAAGVFRALANENPNRRFVMFVKKKQLIQTPAKLQRLTHMSVLATSASKSALDKAFSAGIDNYQVLMLTHHCLQNDRIMKYLFERKDQFAAVVIDEAHQLNNFNDAYSAAVLEAMSDSFEYVWALTATPIISETAQLARLAHVIDKERYPSTKQLRFALERGDFDILDDPCFFISRNGEEFGRTTLPEGKIWQCLPSVEQRQCLLGGDPLMKIMKGPGAFGQAMELVKLILSQRPGRGVIYIRQHEVREWVLPFLDEAGIQYGLINGLTSEDDTREVLRRFNEEGDYDVVITSTEEAVDLDCEYVCFYEFTLKVKQLIGRAQRGFSDKALKVWFMITKDSQEEVYFKRNIYARSELIQRVTHKSYQEIIDVQKEIDGC